MLLVRPGAFPELEWLSNPSQDFDSVSYAPKHMPSLFLQATYQNLRENNCACSCTSLQGVPMWLRMRSLAFVIHSALSYNKADYKASKMQNV